MATKAAGELREDANYDDEKAAGIASFRIRAPCETYDTIVLLDSLGN